MKKFNKKSFITLCAVALMACVCVFTAACTPDVADITEFAEKIENADSMEVVMTMSVPMMGDVEYTMKYDDNKAYTSAVMGSPAQFVEYVTDEIYYTYTESANGWVKEGPNRVSGGTEVSSSDAFTDLFNAMNYEYSSDDKAFVKKDNASIGFEDMLFDSLELVLENNSCVFTGYTTIEGMICEISIEIKNLNSTEIELPEV